MTPSPILIRFFYLLGARGVRELLLAVFFIILARRSTSAYGEFMFALGVGAILQIVSGFGLDEFLVPRLTQGPGNREKSLLQVILIKGGLLISAYLACLAFVSWQGYGSDLKYVVLVISLGAGLGVLGNTFFVSLQVQGLQKREGVIRSTGATGGVAYALITLSLGFPAPVVAFYLAIESSICLCMLLLLEQRRPGMPLEGGIFHEIPEILPKVLVFGGIGVAAIGYNKINLFFLERYGGVEAVAQYSATWQIVDGISALVSGLLLQGAFYPLFAGLWVTKREEALGLGRDSIRWLLAVSILCMYVLHVESDRIIPFIYGPLYTEAVRLQRWLVFTMAFAFLHNVAAFIMLATGQEKRLFAYYLAILGLTVLLCVFLVPTSPLLGAGLAILIGKGALALMTVTHCQLRMRLISGTMLLPLSLCVAIGALLFFSGRMFFGREAGEIFALTPILILMGRWWKEGGR